MLSLTVNELDLEDPSDVLVIREFTSEKFSVPKNPVHVQTYTLSGIRHRFTVTTQGFFELNFRTDSSVSKKGFRLEITVVDPRCGGEVRTSGDYITSPNYRSSYYPANSKCDWRIEAPSKQYNIQIRVISINLTKTDNCADRVILSQHNKPHTVLCGHNASKDIVTLNGSTGSILFRTSGYEKGANGFALQIFFVKRRPSKTTQCGIQTSPFRFADAVREKIVGGTRATIENFPWMALLRTHTTFCSASLVSNFFVVTAAHCLVKMVRVDGVERPVLRHRADQFQVIVGRSKRLTRNPGEQTRNITHMALRDDYHWVNHFLSRGSSRYDVHIPINDIVLLKLNQEVAFSATIQPICLPTQDVQEGDTCYVAGWGDLNDDGRETLYLHYTKAPILDAKHCSSYRTRTDRIFETGVCAGYPAKRTGMCFGDSGGPLFCRGEYGNFYINGVASWSIGCGQVNLPGIYTKLYTFVAWIVQVLEEHGSKLNPQNASLLRPLF